MLPLETKQSGGKLLPQTDRWLGWGDVSGGSVTQKALGQEGVGFKSHYVEESFWRRH